MEKQEKAVFSQTTSQSKLLAQSPLAGSVVGLNEQIRALTLQLEENISKIAEHPEKYNLKQDGLSHVLVKAYQDKADINSLGQQLQNMTVTTYLREKDSQYGFSPIHWLGLKDDITFYKYLMDEGVSFYQRDKLGLFPSHLAAGFGKSNFLLHRLKEVTQFNEVVIEFNDTTQNPPQKLKFVLNELHLSIMGRHLNQVQAIFDTFNQPHASRINPNITTIGNLLHLIVYISCNESPERKSDYKVSAVELLQVVLRNYTADKIKDLLKQKEHNHEGYSPLLLAAKYGQVSLLRELMTYLQVHVEEANGLQEIEHAFYCAARHGQINVVKVLLKYFRFKPYNFHNEYDDTMVFLDNKTKNSEEGKAEYDNTYIAIKNMIRNVNELGYHDTYKKPEAIKQPYKNLVLSGGGGKGFALPYLLQAFKQHIQHRSQQVSNDPLKKEVLSYEALQRVAGTSAGAIFAMALAVGHSPEVIIKDYYDYDFAEFLETDRTKAMVKEMDTKNPNKLHIINQVLQELEIKLQKTKELLKQTQGNHPVIGTGWYALTHPKALYNEINAAINKLKELDQSFKGFSKGENALAFIKNLLDHKGVPSDLTFGELAELVSENPKVYKHLHVVVTNLSKGTFEVLSSENRVYKDYLIVDAVRASMSYPIIFAPHHLRIKENGVIKTLGDEYIDGGVLRNFAIDEFDFKQYTQTQWVGDPRYPELNKETLGFRFEVATVEAQAAKTSEPNDVLGHVKALISIYAEAESLINAYTDREYGRSIAVDTGSITTFTFKRLDDNDKVQLKQNADTVLSAYFKQELTEEKSRIEDLSNQAPAKGTYQTQPVPGVHLFQSGNTNQPQINNNNNTNAWTNYSASSTNTQDFQNPLPK